MTEARQTPANGTLSQRRMVLWGTLVLGAIAGNVHAELTVLPHEVRLRTAESYQRLVVQEREGPFYRSQKTNVEWASRDPAVAEVSKTGTVTPKANGQTEIIARVDGEELSVPVTVEGQDVPFHWNFRNHVLPVLSKTGCNMGACHGALAGKGGLRLSLHGYDPPTDYFNIVKQDRGRRVEFAEPGTSLILAKPTGGIPHKGGLRFDTDSEAYRILAEWVTNGARPPVDGEPEVESLEILPDLSLHSVGETQQMLVTAVFTDGSREDVTPWVKWSSSDQSVADVDDTGLAIVNGPGEGAIVAWYSSKLSLARIAVPFENTTRPEFVEARNFIDEHINRKLAEFVEARNFIDEHINRKLAALNLPPSPPSSDSEFIRRVFVDTIGTLPTADETRQFLADTTPDKRDILIDQLLDRPEFVDYWSHTWSDMLMLNGNLLRPQALKAYYEWIHGHVRENTPWDEMVREILISTGSSFENGATNFYALHQTPEDMTENASQAFLGLSLSCAKCHNHPLEKWTNDQYYAMANLFARVKAKGWGGETRNGTGERTLYVATSGDLVQPRTGRPQAPAPLDSEPIDFDDPRDRRIVLAEWLTSPENPYFARSITNRVWKNYFGVGLVEAADDMRASNPASNEELLTAAANHLIEAKFNLKSLMKAILQSNAYQRSSAPLEGNLGDGRFYSRYYPRRMKAEVLHDAVVQLTGAPTTFDRVAFAGSDFQPTDFYPLGTKAIQLYDSAVDNYFLQAFGRNQRRITCDCERSDEPSMVQALHISNGETINDKLKSADGRIAGIIRLRQLGLSDEALLDEIYLDALSRFPTLEERDEFLPLLPSPGTTEERIILEDLLWALLSSREFIFNH